MFDERARAFDRTSPDGAAEARRKIRTLAGNYQILAHEPRLLLPFANPVWLQYLSHKVGRLLVPWALVARFVASAALAADRLVLYGRCSASSSAFYGLAALAGGLNHGNDSRRPPVCGATRSPLCSGRRLDELAKSMRVRESGIHVRDDELAAVVGLFSLRRGRAVWR